MNYELYLYDEIGPDFFGLISDKAFAKELADIDGTADDELTIFMNSPGGHAFMGQSIATQVARWPGHTRVQVDGIAASAATHIAASADETIMAPGAHYVIHEAWTMSVGDQHTLRADAEKLDSVTNSLIDAYAAKTGEEHATIRQMILDAPERELWIDAESAVEMGFADSVDSGLEAVAASIRPGMFKQTPESCQSFIRERTTRQKSLASPETVAMQIRLTRSRAAV